MSKSLHKILYLLITSLLLTMSSPVANAATKEVKLEIPGTAGGYITITNVVEQKQVEGVKYFFTANSPAKVTFVADKLVSESIIGGTWDDPKEELKFDVKKYKINGDETVYDENFGTQVSDERLYLSGNSATLKNPGTYTIFAGASKSQFYHYVLQILEVGQTAGSEYVNSSAQTLGSVVEGEPRYAIKPMFKDMINSLGRPFYTKSLAFIDGLAFIDYKYIDKTGKVKFGYPGDSMSGYPSFKGGILVFESAGEYGVINSEGKIVVEPGYYNTITQFSTELLKVNKNNKFGLINRNGKEIVPVEFDKIGDLLYWGIAEIYKGNLSGGIDSTGKIVVKLQEDPLSTFLDIQLKYDKSKESIEPDIMSLILKDGKFYLVDKDGKKSILTYDYADHFSNNMFIVRQDKKFGLIDNKTGREVVKPKYDKIRAVDERTFSVVLDGKLGFIDVSGKEFAKPQYDYEGEAYFEDFITGDKNLIRVKKNGIYGLIDYTGKEVIRPQFDTINNFSEGVAAVRLNGLWGFIYNPLDVPSGWAKAEVENAISLGLVPDVIQYGFSSNITRADFSKLVVNLLEVKSKKTAATLLSEKGKTLVTDAFNDTSDPVILTAYSLGIVGGKGDGVFDPNGEITRQEAAVMLSRTSVLLGITAGESSGNFADSKEIASWASAPITFISSVKDKSNQSPVMGSTGNNNFSPKSGYTRQQAFITVKRLFNSF